MIRVLFIGAINPFSEEESRLRPLWPAYLAAYAEKHLGEKNFEFSFTNRKVRYEIATFRPDIVAISAVTKNYGYAVKYASIAKRYRLPVIIGGMHITMLPHCLTRDMDIGCIGEGEQTFAELMRLYLHAGRFSRKDLAKVHGIIYHDGEHLAKTPKRKFLSSLDQLPHPNRSIIGYGRRAYVYTARGCAYNCIFCACTSHWGEVRYSSPEYVVEEVRELIEHGVRIIRFNDDNFIADHHRLHQISALIVKNGFHKKARFSCWCRSNNVTPDVVKALKAMNVVSVKMGLESGCDKTLRYLKGGVMVKDNWNAVNLLKDAGVQVNGDFIIGAPEETPEEMMMTYEFIKNSRVDFVDINVLTPLPGTPVFEHAVRKGIVTDNMDWRKFHFKFSKNPDTAPIISEAVSRQQLHRINKKFQRLRFIKTAKAIPCTPWLSELPLIALKRLSGNMSRILTLTVAGGFSWVRRLISILSNNDL